jgi:hypothetical protein
MVSEKKETDKQIISKKFSKYFSTVGQKCVEAIPKASNPLDY